MLHFLGLVRRLSYNYSLGKVDHDFIMMILIVTVHLFDQWASLSEDKADSREEMVYNLRVGPVAGAIRFVGYLSHYLFIYLSIYLSPIYL